jgi:hypothetical protein
MRKDSDFKKSCLQQLSSFNRAQLVGKASKPLVDDKPRSQLQARHQPLTNSELDNFKGETSTQSFDCSEQRESIHDEFTRPISA